MEFEFTFCLQFQDNCFSHVIDHFVSHVLAMWEGFLNALGDWRHITGTLTPLIYDILLRHLRQIGQSGRFFASIAIHRFKVQPISGGTISNAYVRACICVRVKLTRTNWHMQSSGPWTPAELSPPFFSSSPARRQAVGEKRDPHSTALSLMPHDQNRQRNNPSQHRLKAVEEEEMNLMNSLKRRVYARYFGHSVVQCECNRTFGQK